MSFKNSYITLQNLYLRNKMNLWHNNEIIVIFLSIYLVIAGQFTVIFKIIKL